MQRITICDKLRARDNPSFGTEERGGVLLIQVQNERWDSVVCLNAQNRNRTVPKSGRLFCLIDGGYKCPVKESCRR